MAYYESSYYDEDEYESGFPEITTYLNGGMKEARVVLSDGGFYGTIKWNPEAEMFALYPSNPWAESCNYPGNFDEVCNAVSYELENY